MHSNRIPQNFRYRPAPYPFLQKLPDELNCGSTLALLNARRLSRKVETDFNHLASQLLILCCETFSRTGAGFSATFWSILISDKMPFEKFTVQTFPDNDWTVHRTFRLFSVVSCTEFNETLRFWTVFSNNCCCRDVAKYDTVWLEVTMKNENSQFRFGTGCGSMRWIPFKISINSVFIDFCEIVKNFTADYCVHRTKKVQKCRMTKQHDFLVYPKRFCSRCEKIIPLSRIDKKVYQKKFFSRCEKIISLSRIDKFHAPQKLSFYSLYEEKQEN